MKNRKLRRRNPITPPTNFESWTPPKKYLTLLKQCITEAGWLYYEIEWFKHPKTEKIAVSVILFIIGGKRIFGEVAVDVKNTTESEVVRKACSLIESASQRGSGKHLVMYDKPRPLPSTKRRKR